MSDTLVLTALREAASDTRLVVTAPKQSVSDTLVLTALREAASDTWLVVTATKQSVSDTSSNCTQGSHITYITGFAVRMHERGRGCRSAGSASDRHAADAGSIPQCRKGFFSQSQLLLQTLLQRMCTSVCNCMH